MRLIVVDTIRQHLESDMRLHARCRCGRADWLDLARLVELGFGDVRAVDLGERLRCRACGRKGLEVQRHGPPFESEQAREAERIESEKREKVRPFKRPESRRD